MGSYVVYTRNKGPLEVYWTGEMHRYGVPVWTTSARRARRFTTAREAYDAAGSYRRLGWWRVGSRGATARGRPV